MPHDAATIAPIADALGEYALRRAFQRAKLEEWCDDLRIAGEGLAKLAEKLEHGAALGARANNVRAADVLLPSDLRRADFQLRELRGDDETFRARLTAAGPLARDTYASVTDSRFSVAALDLAGLESVGGFLRRTAARMRGWEERLRGAPRTAGRPSDVAAVRLVDACRGSGVTLRAAAAAAIDAGIERPRGAAGRNRVDLLADRWRKAASARRKK